MLVGVLVLPINFYPTTAYAHSKTKTQLVFNTNQVVNLPAALPQPSPVPPPAPTAAAVKPAGKASGVATDHGFKAGNKGGSCVPFAKKYLGVGGTWGNGGRNLSVNSGPAHHAVVLFGKTHVGVQIDETETQILVIDSNSDWHGTIKIKWYDKTDPWIRGYHVF